MSAKASKRRSGKSARKRKVSKGKAKPKARPAGKVTGAQRAKKIREMRKVLIERREQLRGGMEHSLGAYQSAPVAAKGDVSDLAADALDGDTALQLAESGSAEIAEVDAALEKIEDGTYGMCESCGGEIPWRRLEALPYATMCIECKRQQEVGSGGGDAASGWSAVGELEEMEQD
jgi:DnaK suppressor protein